MRSYIEHCSGIRKLEKDFHFDRWFREAQNTRDAIILVLERMVLIALRIELHRIRLQSVTGRWHRDGEAGLSAKNIQTNQTQSTRANHKAAVGRASIPSTRALIISLTDGLSHKGFVRSCLTLEHLFVKGFQNLRDRQINCTCHYSALWG